MDTPVKAGTESRGIKNAKLTIATRAPTAITPPCTQRFKPDSFFNMDSIYCYVCFFVSRRAPPPPPIIVGSAGRARIVVSCVRIPPRNSTITKRPHSGSVHDHIDEKSISPLLILILDTQNKGYAITTARLQSVPM